MKTPLLAAAWLMGSVGIASASPPIVLDGFFDDWRGIAFDRVDAPNDGEGAFDVCRVSATARGTVVFVRFSVGRVVTLQAGAENDGTLIAEFETDAGRRLAIDLRGRKLWLDGREENRIGHAEVGFMSAPTHSSEQFEMRVDLRPLGVKPGDGVTIRFRGSDEIDEPVRVTTNDEAIEHDEGSIERTDGTALRVASLNVYHNGLTKPERREAIGRLIRAIDADVYCIQEEWRTPAEEIGAAFDAATGAASGTWLARTSGGAAIVSRLRVEFSAQTPERMSLGVVTTTDGGRVAVASVHLKCCGYDGSMEDRTRTEEMRSAEEVIHPMLRAGAGVVIAGDWNLVGSALPLEVMTRSDGPGMRRIIPRHLDGVDCHTWRNAEQSFPPGMLDIVVHSEGLVALRSFVFDTADLSESRLEAAGLERTDSEASDHLMLVTDFALRD